MKLKQKTSITTFKMQQQNGCLYFNKTAAVEVLADLSTAHWKTKKIFARRDSIDGKAADCRVGGPRLKARWGWLFQPIWRISFG